MMCGNCQFAEPIAKLTLDEHISFASRTSVHDNEHIRRPDLHVWSIPSGAVEFGRLGIDLTREKFVTSNRHRRTGCQD